MPKKTNNNISVLHMAFSQYMNENNTADTPQIHDNEMLYRFSDIANLQQSTKYPVNRDVRIANGRCYPRIF